MKQVSPVCLLGGWLTAVLAAVVASVALDAKTSTSAFMTVLGLAPIAIMMLIGVGASSPTVAEILYVADKNGR